MALAAISVAVPALAQESRASIAGRVTDPSDSVVVGAKVVSTNVNTGVSVSAVTNESGSFVIPFLLPGTYRLTASASGFKTYLLDELRLRANDSLGLRIRLEVGSVTETVNVEAGAPQLETADSSVGTVIDERRLLELPQRGGTNQLHGGLYYWARNAAFDAMNFFDNKAGLSKVVYQDHRYGASAGGRFLRAAGAGKPVPGLQPVHDAAGDHGALPARSPPGEPDSENTDQSAGSEPGRDLSVAKPGGHNRWA